MPKFSIIMQSYLGHYDKAASNREDKLVRAVKSVLSQSFTDWELIIVCDGCQRTFDIVCLHFMSHDNIECLLIPKQTQWSGNARNYGIDKASGDYIVYLDIDDTYGKNHLKLIAEQINACDWAWMNDWLMDVSGRPVERRCLINQKGQHGTSNIVHKRELSARWNGVGYSVDDWALVKELRRFENYKEINGEYIVHHIPGRIDL